MKLLLPEDRLAAYLTQLRATRAEREALRAVVRKGYTHKRAAEQFELSRHRIHSLVRRIRELARAEQLIIPAERLPSSMTAEEFEIVCRTLTRLDAEIKRRSREVLVDGKSCYQVALEAGVSRPAVHAPVKRLRDRLAKLRLEHQDLRSNELVACALGKTVTMEIPLELAQTVRQLIAGWNNQQSRGVAAQDRRSRNGTVPASRDFGAVSKGAVTST